MLLEYVEKGNRDAFDNAGGVISVGKKGWDMQMR